MRSNLNKLTILLSIMMLPMFFVCINSNAFEFTPYWMSYNTFDSKVNHGGYDADLSQTPEGIHQVYIAFALNYPVEMTGYTNDIAQKINNLKDTQQPWVSIGGAEGNPSWEYVKVGSAGSVSADDVAASIKILVDKYGFKGVDFDYENGAGTGINNTTATQLYELIKAVHKQMPDLGIAFTFAADNSWGVSSEVYPYDGVPAYLYNVKVDGKDNVFKALWPYLTYVNYMNYNLGSEPTSIASYTAIPEVTDAPYQEEGYWNKNEFVNNFHYAVETISKMVGVSVNDVKAKFMNGINIGWDGVNKSTMSVELTKAITAESKNQGLAGVFTWDLNRDTPGPDGDYQGYNSGVSTGNPGDYTKAILSEVTAKKSKDSIMANAL